MTGTGPGGPAEPVPVALVARTSTLAMQDPVASLNRQIRSCRQWLPAGWYIAGYYWDVESGGIDLEQRSQGDAWRQFADAGIPRDGGMADLLAQAQAPVPPFAAVVCEDIERSGRDTFNALKLEKELSRQGIPLFATDEPASIEGVNATTVLVRRVKQGVAEWFRLQLKEKAWKGLQEHSLAGWNIGTPPYGYLPVRVPHPVPSKAAQGRTKTRLDTHPAHAPVVTQVYAWRVRDKLGIPTITARLNASPALYPSPDGKPWSIKTVANLLRNPKYTGYMVLGRHRTVNGRKTEAPRDQWLWSPEPAHPALIDMATWEAAQSIGAERGNVRDPEMPTSQPGRRYSFRSRLRCRACQRRMAGTTIKAGKDSPHAYVYYRCPHNPRDPRHTAATPGHGRIQLAETTLNTALAQFFRQRILGPERAGLLAAYLPATTADHAAEQAQHEHWLRTELARIDTAQASLMTELETLGGDTSSAGQAYRARIRNRYTELHDERTTRDTELAALHAAAPPDEDPALLDQIPYAPDLFDQAPDHIRERLYEAFDIQALYRHDQHQITIWATITDTTPHAITELITDPRTSHDTHPDHPHPAVSQLTPPPIAGWLSQPCGRAACRRARFGQNAGNAPRYDAYRTCR